MKRALVISLLLFFAGGVWALEPCPETISDSQWDNCMGTQDYGSSKYVGSFKDGKKHGQGTRTNRDGSKFEGVWQDGRQGQGTYTWPNGDVLESCPDLTNPEGYRWSDYKEWDNCATTTLFKSKDGMGRPATDKYFGGWKDGDLHGQGTFTWASGSKFVGSYKDGNKHGQGIFTYADGGNFVGSFKDGKIQGQGTHTYADGDKFVGLYRDGKRHGQGIYSLANGDLDEGEWREDYRHGMFSLTRDGSTSDNNVFYKDELIGKGDDGIKSLNKFCSAKRDTEILNVKRAHEILKDGKNYRLIREQAAQNLKTNISNFEYIYENCIR